MSMDEIEWSSPEFVAQFGVHAGNVLDYLALSPFWDRQCTNQLLQQQNQLPQLPHDCEELTKLTGKEYRVISPQLVQLIQRDSPDDVKVVSCFLLVGAKVYQAPNLASILKHLTLDISLQLHTTFSS